MHSQSDYDPIKEELSKYKDIVKVMLEALNQIQQNGDESCKSIAQIAISRAVAIRMGG